MVRKKTFDVYEPGEPEEVAAAKEAAEEAAARAQKRRERFRSAWHWTLAIVGILLAVSGIVFGINRLVHWNNETVRADDAFYARCLTNGGGVYTFQRHKVCVQGTVVSTTGSFVECVGAGNLPVYRSDSESVLCVQGRIIEGKP